MLTNVAQIAVDEKLCGDQARKIARARLPRAPQRKAGSQHRDLQANQHDGLYDAADRAAIP